MFNLSEIAPQQGSVALITGANTGLGFETARALARTKMKVVMACRSNERCARAKKLIMNEIPDANIEMMSVDLSRLASVRKFAGEFHSRFNRLDLLINNAGIMIPPYSKTEDGFESQMGTNYFSHFLLTGLLFKLLTGTPGSRIVSLASIAHRKGFINFDDLSWEKGYSPMVAYRQSKLACLVFAFELQRRLEKEGYGTISVAAHPGVSLTELVRHIPKWLLFIGKPLTSLMTHSPEKGALPIVYAALGKDVKGGEYFGPTGRQEWTGKPGRAVAEPHSRDKELGKKLWEISEKLTGIKYL